MNYYVTFINLLGLSGVRKKREPLRPFITNKEAYV